MTNSIIQIQPSELIGPRSYFTDFDPRDTNFDLQAVERKLKLQLLTKDKVIIAASSLFHQTGFLFWKNHNALITTLEEGIVIPALRNQFGNVDVFYRNKSHGKDASLYTDEAAHFFSVHVKSCVSWNF